MDVGTLKQLARHQIWADNEHWRVLRENAALLDDEEIRKRLNHILTACEMLQTLARGETPDMAAFNKMRESAGELQAAMAKANETLAAALESADLERMVSLPRGPKGPFEAPAGVILLQALTHGQHHRGQNASRMHQLGVTPPMTDFIMWYAIGQP
ncbi:MAG TPA: DinB family protein [Candidatus Sulfopaludibacter sp.]|nr:DinB family protein [Candidatus Sulfopaludibacter sp.]